MNTSHLSRDSAMADDDGKFAAKKTVAQGMMDLSLITANANQLQYVILYQKESSTYPFIITLIAISIIIQVAIGICLIFKRRSDLKGEEKRAYSNRVNNYVIIGIFSVILINIFIAVFSNNPQAPPQPAVNNVPKASSAKLGS